MLRLKMVEGKDRDLLWNINQKYLYEMTKYYTDITLKYMGKTLIIDAKYYQKSMAAFMGKQMLYSANLYQIYTYVKNLDKSRSGNVSGMLLYAKTTEDIIPSMELPFGGNIISAKTLDLNNEFQMISNTLDTIVQNNFGENLKKTA